MDRSPGLRPRQSNAQNEGAGESLEDDNGALSGLLGRDCFILFSYNVFSIMDVFGGIHFLCIILPAIPVVFLIEQVFQGELQGAKRL